MLASHRLQVFCEAFCPQDHTLAPPPGRGEFQCPDVSYYIADLVINKKDVQALDGLTYHTAQCAHPPTMEMARQIALAAANRAVIFGPQDTQLALSAVRRAIRRLAGLPGQRVIVLASPGFFAQTPEALKATAEILDLAAWAHDAFVLTAPVKVLCREDCAGLCPVCAADLNVAGPEHRHERAPDPRWAKLRELKLG